MSPSAIALAIIFTIVVLGSAIGFYAGTHHKMSLEQWTVGSRGFGPLLMWLLMAGEIYTTFSFLGASGWAYSRGGPALYILAYLSLANVIGFFILPPIWDLGREHGLQTQSDFFLAQYRSKYLAAFVSVVGVAFMIPYLQIQLTGLGIIVEVASFDGIRRTHGGCMWPHTFGASFTAKSADTLRRNAVVLPLYTISLAFIFFTGFAAFLVVPGLSNGDLSLLTVVRKASPPWMLGVVGGAGALTAMVPAAILILTASTLFAKNLCRPIFAPAMTDDQVARLARIMVVALSLISLYFAIYSSTTLVSLLLLGYAGVTQFFPGVVLGLFWKRVKMVGVFAGMIVGVAGTTFLILSNRDPFGGLNAGFIALCANFAVTVLVSMLAPVNAGGFAEGSPEVKSGGEC